MERSRRALSQRRIVTPRFAEVDDPGRGLGNLRDKRSRRRDGIRRHGRKQRVCEPSAETRKGWPALAAGCIGASTIPVAAGLSRSTGETGGDDDGTIPFPAHEPAPGIIQQFGEVYLHRTHDRRR